MTANDSLIQEIESVAQSGFLPDGDGINTSTHIWLEKLINKYQQREILDNEERLVEDIAADICDTISNLNGLAYTPQQWMGTARKAIKHFKHHYPAREYRKDLSSIEKLLGMKISLDETLPKGELYIMHENRVIGKIINIGTDNDIEDQPPIEGQKS